MSTLERLDLSLLRAIYGDPGSPVVRWFMVVLTIVGNGRTFLLLVVLAFFVRTRRYAFSAGATLALAYGFVSILKRLVDRPRPYVALPDIHVLYGLPTDASFPSGHALGNFTLAAFTVTYAWRRGASPGPRVVALLLMGYAALVSLSRIYLGAHYPSDVAGGAILGIAAGITGGWLTTRTPTASASMLERPPAPPSSRPS